MSYVFDKLTDEHISAWNKFNEEMGAKGYHLLVTDGETQDDELAEFGRVMSPLGTRAVKDDRYHPIFKLYVHPEFGISFFILNRCGNPIITGRTICHIKLSVADTEHVLKAIKYAEKYMAYDENNPVPVKLPEETITI